MKTIRIAVICLLLITVIALSAFAETEKGKSECGGKCCPAGSKATAMKFYGESFDCTKLSKLADIKPGKDTVAVSVAGEIVTVCQSAGCWIMLKDGDHSIFVKSKDEAYFMPKNAAGAKAIANGVVRETEMSEAMLKHFAKDGLNLGEIKGPRKMVMMVANGVTITPKEGQVLESVEKYKCDDKNPKSEK